MPHRTPVDRDAIARSYAETGNKRETARRLGIHEQTVYQILRAVDNLCKRCGKTHPVANKVYCATCLTWMSERAKVTRKDRLRKGLCVKCDKPYELPSKTYCSEHRLDALEANQRYVSKSSSRSVAGGGLPNQRQRERAIRGRYGEAGVRVWRRDNGTCILCGVEHAIKAVHIHHIDRNPENSTEDNMTCLCQSCHRTVHLLAEHPNYPLLKSWFEQNYR